MSDEKQKKMKKHRIISVAGFTDKNTATLWDGSSIITATSFDTADFDFGDDAEKQLEYCKAFIKEREGIEGWIPGYVTCWIDEYEIETQETELL